MTTAGPNAANALSVSVARADGGPPIVMVSGELDMATASVLSQHLSELVEDGTDVVVDVSELRFIDSSGLRALIDARRKSHDRGQTLTLRHPSRNVNRVLAITGLDRVFIIEP